MVTSSVCHVIAFLNIYLSNTSSVIITIDKKRQPAANIPQAFANQLVNLINLSVMKNTPAYIRGGIFYLNYFTAKAISINF